MTTTKPTTEKIDDLLWTLANQGSTLTVNERARLIAEIKREARAEKDAEMLENVWAVVGAVEEFEVLDLTEEEIDYKYANCENVRHFDKGCRFTKIRLTKVATRKAEELAERLTKLKDV